MPHEDWYLRTLHLRKCPLTVTSSATNALGHGVANRRFPGDSGLMEKVFVDPTEDTHC